MMSDPSSVDKTTVDELTGKLVLLIEEKRAWHETDLMHRQLAAKVKNYVRYVRSPEFSSQHNQRPDQTIVRLVSDQPPATSSVSFFARVAYELSKHGLSFEHQVGEFGTPAVVTPNADAPVAPPPAAPPAPPAAGQPIAAPPPAAPPAGQPPPIVQPPPPAARPPVSPPVAPGPPPVAAEPPPVAAEPPPMAAEPPPMAPETPPPIVDPFAPGPFGSKPEAFESEAENLELEPESLGLEPEALEVEALDPWSGTDDTTEAIEPEPIELIPEPGMGADESLPSLEPEPAEPTFGFEADGEEAFPDFIGDGEATVGQETSDLERLIETEGAGGEEMEFIDLQPSGPAQAGGLGAVATEEDLPRPPFFPEEEFGRAPYEVDDIDFLDADADTAIIETGAGKKFRLEVDAAEAEIPGVTPVEKPSLLRAIAAAFVAAIAGAVVWGLLSVPAGQGAHPLAVAVGIMVGFSVRIRGNGQTMPYRIVGMFFTLIGSAVGAVLAAAALTAMEGGLGIEGITTILSDVNALPSVVQGHFGPVSLVSVALALYLAFRLSASKPKA